MASTTTAVPEGPASCPRDTPRPIRIPIPLTRIRPPDLVLQRALTNAYPRDLRKVYCELEAHHDGHHIAFAHFADDGEDSAWWLCWEGDIGWRKLIELAYCPAGDAGPHFDSDNLCLLPQHPGSHSFQIITPLVKLQT